MITNYAISCMSWELCNKDNFSTRTKAAALKIVSVNELELQALLRVKLQKFLLLPTDPLEVLCLVIFTQQLLSLFLFLAHLSLTETKWPLKTNFLFS